MAFRNTAICSCIVYKQIQPYCLSEGVDYGFREEPAYRYHGKYRETSPQYLAGRGAVRYSAALRHLIPVRSRQKK